MAHQAKGRALWRKGNKQEQGLVIHHPKFADILNNKRPGLTKIVQPSHLWTHLGKYNVLDKDIQDEITKPTRQKTVEQLLDHVECGPSWRLHAFMRACSLTHQEHVVRLIGLNPGDYDGPSPPESDEEDESPLALEAVSPSAPSPPAPPPSASLLDVAEGSSRESGQPSSHSQQRDQEESVTTQILRQALIDNCKYNKNNLMKARVFDFKHEDPADAIYNLVYCYIKQVPDLREYKRAKPIEMVSILKPYGEYEEPTTVLLEGDPGTGKSTFNRCFTHHCSQELLQYLLDKTSDVSYSDQMLAIYIPAKSLTPNLWDSVENALHCKPGMKKVIMQRLKLGRVRRGYKAALLFDGIDEVRDQKVLCALKEFITTIHNEGGPQILISARTGLSRMDKSLFDRFLSLEGFTCLQGVEYAHKYITQHSTRKTTQHHESTGQSLEQDQVHPVLCYVDKHHDKMKAILSNPLRTHLLSALAVEGLLELNDESVLQPVQLWMKMEDFFIMRETKGKSVCLDERYRFYKMCLYGLLEGIRDFTDDHLQKFKVSTSAYISFFTRYSRMENNAKRTTYYSFEHEVLNEYFAARAIETLPEEMKNTLLLYICSNDILRNLQKLTFSILGEYGGEGSVPLLVGMTRLLLLRHALIIKSGVPMVRRTVRLTYDHDVVEETEEEIEEEVEIEVERLHGPWTRKWYTFVSNLQTLQQKIATSFPSAGVLLLQQDTERSLDDASVSEMWQMVATTFDLFTELTKRNESPHGEHYWVGKYFTIDCSPGGFVRNVILDLLSDCPIQLRTHIAKNTYHRMLPCNSVYPCGNIRWVDMGSDDNITCWSPEDVIAGILQHQKDVPDRVTTFSLNIDFTDTPPLWGHAPADHWTSAAWDAALQALTTRYVSTFLMFTVHDTFPVQTLLYCVTDMNRSDKADHDIQIWNGDISLEDLYHWYLVHNWYQMSGDTHHRTITLWYTTLQLPADEQTREQLLQWVGGDFQQAVKRHIANKGQTYTQIKQWSYIYGLSVIGPHIAFM